MLEWERGKSVSEKKGGRKRKLTANGAFLEVEELPLHKAKDQGTLPDTALAQENELVLEDLVHCVVGVGGHSFREKKEERAFNHSKDSQEKKRKCRF